MAMKKILALMVPALAAAAIVGLLVFGVAQKATNATLDDAIQKGHQPVAPDATRVLPGLGSNPSHSLADFRGHVVVLNFWASWCTTCIGETKTLEQAQRVLAAHGGTILGATYQDVRSDSEDFLRRYHLTYPNVVDSDIKLATAFGTGELPETFVINRRGRVVAISRGQVSEQKLNRWITQALAS
jgi:cytochrome c biogenesis protein CcmG/thiol:disulfide interchange protein DsbE